MVICNVVVQGIESCFFEAMKRTIFHFAKIRKLYKLGMLMSEDINLNRNFGIAQILQYRNIYML